MSEVSRRSLIKWSGAGALAAGAAMALPAQALASPPGAVAALAADTPKRPVTSPDSASAVARAKRLVAQMTLDEKIVYCHGMGFGAFGQGHAGSIPANTRLNIPELFLADAPGGVGDGAVGVTQWPDSKSLASTWNPQTAREFGSASGAEQAGKGNNFVLGPCIDILRLPNWGRSFETYTEDPYLNGEIAAGTIQGMQGQHVSATVKHFAVNNQEILRNSIDVIVSPRALQEIYYPGYKAAVQKGHSAALMTSYNQVNGHFAQENLVDIQENLRDTWGFVGMVMSDWGGTHSTLLTAKSGADTEMPGDTYLGAALKAAVEAGSVSMATLDGMVTHVLTAVIQVGMLEHRLPDPSTVVNTVVSTPAHRMLARQMGIEGSVLLKNTGTLPFHRPSSIAVIGDAADAGAVTHGGGSGAVNATGTVVTPLAGIKARAGSIPVTFARGTLGIIDPLPTVPDAAFGSGLAATYYNTTDFTGTPAGTATVPNPNLTAVPKPVAGDQDGWSATFTGVFTATSAGWYRFSLAAAGSFGGGGGTATLGFDGKTVLTYLPNREATQNALVELSAGAHPIKVTYSAPAHARGASLTLGYQPDYRRLHAEAAAVARAAEVAVVFVADFTSEGMDRSDLGLPADQDELVAAVAAANRHTIVVTNTSGTVLMPWIDQVSAVIANHYAGQEQGNGVAAMLFGDDEPGGRLTETYPRTSTQGPAKTSVEYPGDGTQVYYDEDLAVGYRWYESSGERPLFAFGHGLSYTTFAMSDLRVDSGSRGLRASLMLANTGRRTGSEVVQLYVQAPAAAKEPSKQLKAFQKVTLRPHERRRVELDVAREDLAVWLDAGTGWTVVPGTYRIQVGSASDNLPLQRQVRSR